MAKCQPAASSPPNPLVSTSDPEAVHPPQRWRQGRVRPSRSRVESHLPKATLRPARAWQNATTALANRSWAAGEMPINPLSPTVPAGVVLGSRRPRTRLGVGTKGVSGRASRGRGITFRRQRRDQSEPGKTEPQPWRTAAGTLSNRSWAGGEMPTSRSSPDRDCQCQPRIPKAVHLPWHWRQGRVRPGRSRVGDHLPRTTPRPARAWQNAITALANRSWGAGESQPGGRQNVNQPHPPDRACRCRSRTPKAMHRRGLGDTGGVPRPCWPRTPVDRPRGQCRDQAGPGKTQPRPRQIATGRPAQRRSRDRPPPATPATREGRRSCPCPRCARVGGRRACGRIGRGRGRAGRLRL